MTPDQLLSKLDTISLRDLDAKERWETLEQIKSAHKASARKHAPSGLEMERRIKLLRYWQELVRLYAEDKQLGEPVVEVSQETVAEEAEAGHEGEAWVRVRVLKGCVIRGVQLMIGHVIDLTPHDLEELLAQGVVAVFSDVTEDTASVETPPVEVPPRETEPNEVAPDESQPLETPPREAAREEIQLEEKSSPEPSADKTLPDDVPTAREERVEEAPVDGANEQAVETEISAPVVAAEQPSESVEAEIVEPEIVAAPDGETAPDPVADVPEIQMAAEPQITEPAESVAEEAPEAAALDGIFAVMDEAEYGPKVPGVAIEPPPLAAEIQEQVVPEISGLPEASLPAEPPEPEFFDLPSFPFLPKKIRKAEPEPEPVPDPDPEPKPFPKLVFKSEQKAEKAPGKARADGAEPQPNPEPEFTPEPEPQAQPQPVETAAAVPSEVLPPSTAQMVGILEDRSVRVDADDSAPALPVGEPGLDVTAEEAVPSGPEEPAIPLEEALARLARRPKIPPGYHNKRADELEREAAAETDPAFRRQLLESAEKFRKMALSSARIK